MASTVTYEFYSQTYGGGLSEAAFAASLPIADSHVKWLCEVKGAKTTCNVFKRAVCAASTPSPSTARARWAASRSASSA